MPRWKTTEQLLHVSKDGELFDENWMNYDSIYQYMPPSTFWNEQRPIKFEDVDVWEVIAEWTGLSGIYAAWLPYSHYFIVIENWKIVSEYWGIEGEKLLQEDMKKNNIPISLNKVWIEDESIKIYTNDSENKKIIY